MKYTWLEQFDFNLSSLVYGTGNGVVAGNDAFEAYDCIDMAWNMGFNVFDSANAYGNAEKNLGIWLYKSGNRDSTFIVTKGMNCGMNGSADIYSADTIHTQIKLSLERLQTDYIDAYILHRDDESKPVAEAIDALNENVERGYIRNFGASNWKKNRIIEANNYAEKHGLKGFKMVSPAFSLADYLVDPWNGSVSLSGKKNEEYRKWLRDNQMPVFNYSSLARGFLSGKYKTFSDVSIEKCLSMETICEYNSPENVARLSRAESLAEKYNVSVSAIVLAWIFRQGLNIFSIISSTSEKNLLAAVDCFNCDITERESNYLFEGD